MLERLLPAIILGACLLLAPSFSQASEEGGKLTSLTPLGRGEARFVTGTADGGYAVTGWVEAAEGSAVFLSKCDAQGRLLWQREYYGHGYSCGYCVREVQGGGFIVVGDTKSPHGYDHDVYVVRTDEKGQVLWEKTFGGPHCDYAWNVEQTTDGGFILAGGTESYGAGQYDVYLLRLGPQGEKLWEKTYGGWASDVGYALLEIPGGYLVAGNTASFGAGSTDVYLLCTDEHGQLRWQRAYGGGGAEYGWSLAEAPDGYLVAAEKEVTGEKGAYLAPCLLKVDAQGNLLWERTYGDRPGAAYGVFASSRGCVLAGKREGQGGYYNLWLAEVNEGGDLLWEKACDLGGAGSCGYALLAKGLDVVVAGRRQDAGASAGEAVLLVARTRGNPPLVLLAVTGALVLAGVTVALRWGGRLLRGRNFSRR